MRKPPSPLKIRLILFQRLFLLFLIALVVVAIRRPDWRLAAERAAAPYVERGAQAVVEKARAWRGEHSGAASRSVTGAGRPAPSPGSETALRPERPDAGGDVATRGHEGDALGEQPRANDSGSAEPGAGGPPEEGPVSPAGDLPPRLPTLRASRALPASLRELRAAANVQPSATGYRRLADAAAPAFPEIAADAYEREARIYRKLGDPNAAVVEELKAGRYHSEGRLYLHAFEPPPVRCDTHARLEPAYGALLGAFVDRDDQLDHTFMDENWQTHREPQEFAELAGKRHASFFCYLRYGQPFPSRWAERLRDEGVIPHIAWEPGSLSEVMDNGYLERFAAALAQFDAPIFIRFAGEMNGDWTPYHGNPALYRQKFRLVHRVIAPRAPKAALIWCVNSIPADGIDAYYPGDDAVDWVGVNLYNVLYFDNDRTRPAAHVHPVDLLQPIYARYAARKPIALCEYAASHRAAVDPTPRPEFAITRLDQLYAALPRLFPRVKLVDWFDCNNLRHARPDRQLNDYSLSDDPAILRAYSEAIAPDYFLGQPDDRPRATIRPLRENESLSGVVTLSAWVRTYLDRPRVYLLADDQVLYAGDSPGAPVCRWDTRQASPGAHEIRLVVTDPDGQKILDERQRVEVAARS